MRWSSEGKVAVMGTVTPVALWGRKILGVVWRYSAPQWWPEGMLGSQTQLGLSPPGGHQCLVPMGCMGLPLFLFATPVPL